MRIIADDTMQQTRVSNFSFSGVRPEKLGATEYTLVTLVTDITGSVRPFAAELLAMKQAVVDACRKNPRSAYLMLRNIEFNASVDEINGFTELDKLDSSAWTEPNCGGVTALYDATFNAVAATNEYARILSDQDFFSNGICFVITDGDDIASFQTPKEIAAEQMRGVNEEWLESMKIILIGINVKRFRAKLELFVKEANLAQFEEVASVTPESLARIAGFVSNSISSQSNSLGTGGPSQALTF